jgi:hypothetical protein
MCSGRASFNVNSERKKFREWETCGGGGGGAYVHCLSYLFSYTSTCRHLLSLHRQQSSSLGNDYHCHQTSAPDPHELSTKKQHINITFV